jgi:hypothetical protein
MLSSSGLDTVWQPTGAHELVLKKNKLWEELIASFDTTRTALRTTCPTTLLLLCVFVAAVTFFTEPLPSNDMGIDIQTQDLMGGIYER